MTRTRGYVAGGLVIVIAVIAALLFLGGGDSPEDDLLGTGEVFLEPAGDAGTTPFAEGAVRSGAAPPAPRPAASTEARGLATVSGTSPGLYGAERGVASCDTDVLASAINADTQKVTAWSQAAGITTAETTAYLDGLASLTLRADTRVTDHSYAGGRAVAKQAVLQAGTAVLVDDFGSPVVRCASGSPLQPPEPARAGATYTGTPWPSFDPQRAVVVTRAPEPVTQLVVVDLAAPGYLNRPLGSAAAPEDVPVFVDTLCELFPAECAPPSMTRPPAPTTPSGEIADTSITLRWSSTADLDLAVTDPSGATISYQAPAAAGGAALDRDANGACRVPTSAPSESIAWPAGSAGAGTYTITVSYYDECEGGSGPQPFTLEVNGARTAGLQLIADTSSGLLNAPGDSSTSTVAVGSPYPDVPPGPVVNPSAQPTWPPGTVYVSWIPNIDERFGIETGYVVTVEPGGIVRHVTGDVGVDLVLEPGTDYTITVAAENAQGVGPAQSVSVTTDEAVPEEPPVEPPPATETPPATPPEETLEERCDRLYGPAGTSPAENPMWTLCMHDPTG